jgi:hypothetical protein
LSGDLHRDPVVEGFLKLLYCILVKSRNIVGVEIKGRADLRMSKTFLDDLRVNPLTNPDSGMSMLKVMGPDSCESGKMCQVGSCARFLEGLPNPYHDLPTVHREDAAC